MRKKLSSRELFSFHMSRWRIYLSISRPLCVWSTFWCSSHQDISNLSTDLNFLGQVWDNKTICNMKRWEIKIFLSFLVSLYMSRWRIYLSVHLCVWSIFWPPSHQDISNLSTDLDFLCQVWVNKIICNIKRQEIRFFYHPFFHFICQGEECT